MADNLKTKFASGLIWNILDKLISQFGFLIATLYLAQLIGPESFGLIGMLMIFMLLAESVVSNGFTQALVQRSHALTNEDASTVFYVNLVWGVSIYATLYLAAPLIAQFYGEPVLTDISRLLFLVIIINSLTVVVRAQLLINVDFKSQALASALATILSSFVGLYLAISGYDYWAFVWMLVLRAIVQSIAIWGFTKWLPMLVFSWSSFRRLFGFGSNLMFAGLVSTFVNNIYVVLVGKYFNAASVGYFTQSTNLTNYLSQFIASTMQGVSYPVLASIREDRERMVRVYQKTVQLTMLISFPILLGFSAVAENFVEVFLGDEWRQAVPIIQILCFARAITPISNLNMNILNVIGRSDLFLKVDIIKVPLTLTTLFVSVHLSLEAVAIAIFVNVLISFLINSYFPGKFFGFGAFAQFKAASKYILSSLLMYFSVIFLGSSGEFYWLFINIFLGLIVYILSLILLRDQTFLAYCDEMIKKVIS